LVGQDKGGVGKSTAVRAVAEAIPGVAIIEIDSSHRLLEFDAGKKKGEKRQVAFFPTRADRDAIEQSGGLAARAEFDAVVRAIETAEGPTVVDIGANTCGNFFKLLAELAPDLKDAGLELGVLAVVTAQAAALGAAAQMIGLAEPWMAALFVLENRLSGKVDPAEMARIARGGPLTTLDHHVMDSAAIEIIQARGLKDIPNVDRAKLNAAFGISQASRIRKDLTNFRLKTMEAVLPAAEWLANG
jgi:hypothetical protein